MAQGAVARIPCSRSQASGNGPTRNAGSLLRALNVVDVDIAESAGHTPTLPYPTLKMQPRGHGAGAGVPSPSPALGTCLAPDCCADLHLCDQV